MSASANALPKNKSAHNHQPILVHVDRGSKKQLANQCQSHENVGTSSNAKYPKKVAVILTFIDQLALYSAYWSIKNPPTKHMTTLGQE